jgi:Na+/H+ antiporter NhaC
MDDHPFGWWSLAPPLVAIVLAITTRRVIASLSFGLLAGVLIWQSGMSPDLPTQAVPSGAVEIEAANPPSLGLRIVQVGKALTILLRNSLAAPQEDGSWDVGNIKILLFTLIMGAMVGTVYQNGGMSAVANSVATWANSRRRGQLATWMLGLIVFIDDYANALLLGNTMRPVTDRLRISREKLAYIVDSTAAPVSGLALVSTWVAGELSYIQEGLKGVTFLPGTKVDAFALFVLTIPTRFYVLWALLFVAIVAWMQRDFGPMLTAERRAAAGDPVGSEASSTKAGGKQLDLPAAGHWASAVIPILLTVSVTFAWIIYSGMRNLEHPVLNTLSGLVDVFGEASTSDALILGSLSGWIAGLLAGLLAGMRRAWVSLLRGSFTGAQHVIPACFILWLAWAVGDIADPDHLRTASFLANAIQSVVAPWALPTAIFVLASFVAFSTGTSWGTMGILMPIVLPTVASVLAAGGPVSGTDPILVASVAGVLSGAIWGDHCSPISDTTVLSSVASGCDHIAHVRTQMPYALLVGCVSIVCGTLLIGCGVSVWITHLLGITTLIVALRVFGKEVIDQVPVSKQ